jgi:hypothetical protein
VVTPHAEFVDEPWVLRTPTEFVASLGGDGALIKEDNFCEVVSQSRPSLVV